ncbi:MAG: TonB-dependent receptor [Pseudomonadales bacterium]|nr:TonB-dependent receptor [Pseudomonadales bacterium]MBO6594627.1 TonB-dependent receptor [Pseudomonadales bacterium]MBO6821813.1 TonB-dependent receptor [Pseudomonadales bacterium]
MKKILAATLAISASVAMADGNEDSLEEILVVGKALTSLSESGSRLSLALKEIPATVDVIDGDAMRIRRDVSLLEAVTRSAGFTGAGNPGNGGTSMSARGFTGQDVVTKLYDGNNYYTMASTITFPFDTWAVERVEILKGPASVLYGLGGIAGAYNVVPKSPSAEFVGMLRISAGEDGERYYGLGLTGSVSDSVIARIDYSDGDSDNWVNNGSSDTQMLAVALAWQATEDLTLSFRYDSGDQSPLRYFGVPVVGTDFDDDLVDLNLSVGDTDIKYDDEITRVIAEWNASDTMSVNIEAFELKTDRYWQTVETYFFNEGSGLIDRFDPLIIRHEMQQTGGRANFVFDSELKEMPLKMSLGFETTDISLDYTSNFNGSHPDSVDWGGDFDTVDPSNFIAGSWYDVSDSIAALDQVSDAMQWAVFGEAQLKVTDQVALVAGIRHDSIETDYERLTYNASGDRDTSVDNSVNQKVNPTMYRFGVVFDMTAGTTFYGQLSSGETHPRGGDIVRVSNSLREADTVKVEQYEVGLKQSLFDERLTWNLAVFDITRENMLIDDPDSSDPTDFTTVPEQTSQGVEIGLSYSANERLITYANAALVDAERDTGIETIDTPYAPKLTANVGMLYKVTDALHFGADYRYVDDRPYENRPLPAYSVVDLSMGYSVNEHVRVMVNAQNVFDELYATADHWTGGQWLVGRPRTLSMTFDVNF